MRISIKEKESFKNLINKMFNTNIKTINSFCIDSRQLQKNDIFLAIKGNNSDGHDFIEDAINAKASMIFSEKNYKNKKIINVRSTKEVLKNLAYNWINLFNKPIIAITGSNGKTTTKELLYHIMNKKFSCSKTIGNFNSTIGLPITFLNSKLNDDYCILEYGASKPDEIEYLCNIIRPDLSYVTNVSYSHIANFESLKQLNETKLYLYSATKKTGKCFINTDLIKINKDTLKSSYLEYSINNHSKLKCDFIPLKKQLIINDVTIQIPDQLGHLKENILGVYMIAYYLGIENKEIINSINSFDLPRGRGNIVKYNEFSLLDDSYNANPSSFKIAIKRLNNINVKGKKILVVADMLELGSIARDEHENIARLINNTNIDIIITYGNLSEITQKYISKKKYSKHYNNKNKMKIEINNLICENDIIYLKGSRSMGLEYIYKEN